MSQLQITRWIRRHWAFAAAITLWLLLVLLELRRVFPPDASEALRLVVAIATMALSFFQWQKYRKSDSGLHLAFLTAAVLAFCVPAIWIGLNVIRYYTYNPNRDASFQWVYSQVIFAQDVLFWIGAVLIALTAIVGTLDFLRFATRSTAR